MKRRFCLVLSLLMLAVCIHALAESAEWNYDAEYCVLRGYSGAGGDVAVPGEINGGTVGRDRHQRLHRGNHYRTFVARDGARAQEQRHHLVSQPGERIPSPEPGGHQPPELWQLRRAC